MKVCSICLEPLAINDLDNMFAFLHPSLNICLKCLNKLRPVFKTFTLNDVEGLYVYEYKEHIQNLLYKFKGCGDYALKDIFLSPYKRELKSLFHGFRLVPMPSFKESEEKRGFKHVKEMFLCLDMPFLEILDKVSDIKQAASSRKKRWENRSNIIYNKIPVKENLKILLIDDVMTTGATLLRAIEIVKKFKPKVIKILLMSKKIEIIR